MTIHGPFQFDPRATRLVSYLKGSNGDYITCWFKGEQVATSTLKVLDGAPLGTVEFAVPAGATLVSTCHEQKQVLFS